MARKGRPVGSINRKYRIYQIIDEKEEFLEICSREKLKSKYGISTKRLASDIAKGLVKKGTLGIRYRVEYATLEESKVTEEKKSSMPKHVERIKTASGCRFKG